MTHGLARPDTLRATRGLRALGVAALLFVALAEPIAAQVTKQKAVRGSRATTAVAINRVALDAPTLDALQVRLGAEVAPGDYWYDAFSGLYGLMGGPALGFTVPGLELGGALPSNASGGGTRVFVNGRELHPMDVAALMAVVGPVIPGRYWLRYDGYYGVEGGPPMGNLMALAQQQGGGGYNRTGVGGHIGSDGQTSFYLDPGSGCSVIPGAGVSC